MGKLKEILEKLTWSHVFVIIFLSGGFFYFMLDQSDLEMRAQSVTITQEEVNKAEKKIQEAKDFERQFEAKKKHYNELVGELKKIQGALPKQFFLPDLLSELLREAKKLELEVTSITPDAQETQEELYNALGFNIDLNGTFVQFFVFMDRLANLNRLVNVQSFEITPVAGKKVTLGGEQGLFAGTNFTGGRTLYNQITGRLRVITYRYREKAAPVAATAAEKK